jgi:hypothetical protein
MRGLKRLPHLFHAKARGYISQRCLLIQALCSGGHDRVLQVTSKLFQQLVLSLGIQIELSTHFRQHTIY